jgi:hypothetical protein
VRAVIRFAASAVWLAYKVENPASRRTSRRRGKQRDKPDRSLDETIKEDAMSDLTRRGFVTKSAGAAAGMTAIGALTAAQADADRPKGSDPVVAYVRDPSKGEISVMTGDREVTVRDRKLAARIERAAR